MPSFNWLQPGTGTSPAEMSSVYIAGDAPALYNHLNGILGNLLPVLDEMTDCHLTAVNVVSAGPPSMTMGIGTPTGTMHSVPIDPDHGISVEYYESCG